MITVVKSYKRDEVYVQIFQNLGRSLMLPVAVLPAAAIIVGIGHAKCIVSTSSSCDVLYKCRETILEQLGILFAIGVAIGMAKKTMVQLH